MSRDPRPSRSFHRAERTWLNKRVSVFVRGLDGQGRIGPYEGVVKGLSTNEVAASDEASAEFSETGLLVEIPAKGRHPTYGEWPVWFSDATLI